MTIVKFFVYIKLFYFPVNYKPVPVSMSRYIYGRRYCHIFKCIALSVPSGGGAEHWVGWWAAVYWIGEPNSQCLLFAVGTEKSDSHTMPPLGCCEPVGIKVD